VTYAESDLTRKTRLNHRPPIGLRAPARGDAHLANDARSRKPVIVVGCALEAAMPDHDPSRPLFGRAPYRYDARLVGDDGWPLDELAPCNAGYDPRRRIGKRANMPQTPKIGPKAPAKAEKTSKSSRK
jgi:hypothetical protein